MVRQPETPPIKNRILAGLPPSELERLLPCLTPVNLGHGKILYKAGEVMKFVYFPDQSMVSLISVNASGESVEVGIVGFEGVAGISVVLGVDKSPYELLVQNPDGAMRMSVADLREEFKLSGVFRDRLLRYAHALLVQTSQVAACNRLHTVSERLARWLLMSYDRCESLELPFTQEFLALMLGTRRPSVTEAAIILQAEGSISYRRGLITILDAENLREHSCDCYPVIKAEFDALIAF